MTVVTLWAVRVFIWLAAAFGVPLVSGAPEPACDSSSAVAAGGGPLRAGGVSRAGLADACSPSSARASRQHGGG